MPVAESSSSISASLIERARKLEPDAWQRLTDLFGPLVYRWGRKSGLQSSDAADVMQDVFRAVAANIQAFDRSGPGHTFRGWLWTITRNKIRDHFRRQHFVRKQMGELWLDNALSSCPTQQKNLR